MSNISISPYLTLDYHDLVVMLVYSRNPAGLLDAWSNDCLTSSISDLTT